MAKTETIRLTLVVDDALVHQKAQRVMGAQEAIECLEAPDGLATAPGALCQTLMGSGGVDEACDRPSCMIRTPPCDRRCPGGLQKRGPQAGDHAVTGQPRLRQGVLDAAHAQLCPARAARGGTGREGSQQ